MKKVNVIIVGTVMTLGLVSFILIETNSQIIKKEKIVIKEQNKTEVPKLIVKPIKPKVDTLLHKIDTITQTQQETRVILINTGKRSENALEKLKDLRDYTSEQKKDEVVFDTVVIFQPVKDSIIIEKVFIDTVVVEKTFFQKLFKFLPFKKRRE